MEQVVRSIVHHTEWLYTVISHNQLFFIDLWSVHHFWSGFSLIILLRALGFRSPLLLQVILLFSYEVFEILIVYLALDIFKPEIIKDQFTDIFIGLAGGILCELLLKKLAANRHLQALTDFFQSLYIAITASWIWVGFHETKFTNQEFNQAGINFYLFAGMAVIFLFGLIPLQHRYHSMRNKIVAGFLLTMLLLMAGLIVLEGFFELRLIDKNMMIIHTHLPGLISLNSVTSTLMAASLPPLMYAVFERIVQTVLRKMK